MHELQQIGNEVWNTPVDLLKITTGENEEKSVGGNPAFAALELMANQTPGEVNRRATDTRRKLLDKLIEETGGTSTPASMNLNRGWNFNAIGPMDAAQSILKEAFRNWLAQDGNLFRLKQIRQSEEFKNEKKKVKDLKGRHLVIDEILNKQIFKDM